MTFPIAIDYNHGAPTYERHSLPLPPVPEGWTRLLAEDYSAGDEWKDVPAVTEERELTPEENARVAAGDFDSIQDLVEFMTDEDAGLSYYCIERVITPAYRRQTASGVCKEYQRRAEEWAANRPKPDDTEQRRAALLADLAAKRYALEVGGFDYMGKRVMSDRESQAKIQGLMVGVQLLGDAFKTSWKCEGGEWLDLDKNGALSLVAAALTHVSRLYTREAALSSRIKAAATKEEIDAIAQEGFQ